jgi:RNA polymerase sigma factor (sigma-70 family)
MAPDAWAVILRNHGKDIQRAACCIVEDTALAEDICQETLLQIRDYAGRFVPPLNNPEAAAKGWIMRIACSTALRIRRSRSRKRRFEASLPEPQPSETISEATALALRREVISLPDDLRQPVLLRFYGELDYPQIAAELRLSEVAVRKRVSRGVDRLRQRLAGAGAFLSAMQLDHALAHIAQAPAVQNLIVTLASRSHPSGWEALLTSTSQAGIYAAAAGGMTLMVKISMTAAVLAAVTISGVVITRSFGADEKPAAVSSTPAASDAKAVAESDQQKLMEVRKFTTTFLNAWISPDFKPEQWFTEASRHCEFWEQMAKPQTDVQSENFMLLPDGRISCSIVSRTNPQATPPSVSFVRVGDSWKIDLPAPKQAAGSDAPSVNELAAIAACKAYAEAQEIYRRTDWDGDGLLEYSQSIGGKFSLCDWKKAGDGALALLDKTFAQAEYQPTGGHTPRRGYLFKVLTKQGAGAIGGVRDYVGKNNMMTGYALVAFPADYANAPSRTYIINNNGVVFARDLGENTLQVAAAMDAFNPDATWTLAEQNAPNLPAAMPETAPDPASAPDF